MKTILLIHFKTDLNNTTSTTITFTWNTSDVSYGNYTISVYATQTSQEIGKVGGCIVVTLLGDLNADSTVNIKDLFQIAKAFGASLGQEKWNSNADLNEDRLIKISDLFIIAKNFGKTLEY